MMIVDVTPLPVIATERVPEPEVVGPPEGLHTAQTTRLLAGDEPETSADDVIVFMRRYFDAMHPVYHFALDPDAPDWAAYQALTARQSAVREAYWRRNDDYFVGGAASSTDHRFDTAVIDDWSAARIAPRTWQVTWANHAPTMPRHCGAIVVAFNDGLRLVDELYDEF